MKTTTQTMLAALAFGVCALAANAQDDNQPPMNGHGSHGHRPPPLPLVLVLDVNHDRVIDSSEIANAPAELLTLDKNGDGQLTADEIFPVRPADAPTNAPRPPTPQIIKALDVNGDGIIDANEIANAPAELLTLDKNGDGQLSRDEFCPRPPAWQNDSNGDNQNPPDDAPPGPPPNE